jgi:PAS domain S-box-containing protein
LPKPPTILLIGHEPATVERWTRILQPEDYALRTARSLPDALDCLRSDHVAVIMLDVEDSGLDAYQVAKALRLEAHTRHTPIIFISSLAHDESRALRAYAVGAVDYLSAPLVPEILRAKVARLIELHRETDEARRRLQVTLSSIGDAVIATDLHGAVSFLNPVAEILTGWPPKDAVGQPLETVFHIVNEDTRQLAENPVRRALRDGTIVGLANHTVLISRDGRELPIDDSAAPIRGEGGAIAGVVLVFRDVTEARRAFQASAHLAAIVESSDDPIISKDLNGIILSWNKAAERLYGYTAEEVIGRPISLLVPPDRPDEIPALLERLKHGEVIEHFETERLAKDGRRVHVSLRISPIRDASGRVVAASKLTRDITPLKRTAEALRFLADASKLLAGLLNDPGVLQEVIRRAVPFLGDWAFLDLIGDNGQIYRVASAVADPHKEHILRELEERYPLHWDTPYSVVRVLKGGQSELANDITDEMLQSVAGDARQLELFRAVKPKAFMTVPLAARDRVLGALSLVAGESGRRYDESDLRLAEDFAHRAAIAIDNTRLYQKVEEANRRKDEFLAMLSHELRNPLAPIRNALHILRMPGIGTGAAEQARQLMDRQVQHIVRLVDDLLDVSRIMRGRIELRKELVDLAGVVSRAVETAQPVLDAQGQDLVMSMPEEPVFIEGDATRLAQVVANLLNNAAKYSRHAGRVWLTAGRQRGDVVLRVRDTGAGIPPALLPHVFDLFVQGDRSLERTQGGLGIGLTIVKRLVEMHGGTVEVHSEGPGKGSEFVVRLPAYASTSVPTEPEQPHEQIDGKQPRRVLVVDDNVDAAESIAMLLRHWGNEVRMAHNGPQALEVATAFSPDVVVLDIGLPGMSGYEVAHHLREQPRFARTKLVAVTGYGKDEDRRRSQEVGFDRHLVKPVDPDQLQSILAGT